MLECIQPPTLQSSSEESSYPVSAEARVRSYGQVEVLNPGPLSLIQDNGRKGSQHLGISVGGVADRHAAGWANRLLRNKPDAALLEVCLGGLSLRFKSPAAFSLTGADMQWTLDGLPLANWQTQRAQAGSVLRSAMATAGVRSYVGFDGGLDVPAVCGSRATTVAEALGGIDGRALRCGDELSCAALSECDQQERPFVRQVPQYFQRNYVCREPTGQGPGWCLVLRVVPSNQFSLFPENEIQRFFDTK